MKSLSQIMFATCSLISSTASAESYLNRQVHNGYDSWNSNDAGYYKDYRGDFQLEPAPLPGWPDSSDEPNDDRWRVNTKQPVVDASMDDDLADRIANVYKDDPRLSESAREIDVQVKNGIAVLTGTVVSWYEKDRVEALAKSVKGTKGVVNKLEVFNQ
jgi:hypothetical protein